MADAQTAGQVSAPDVFELISVPSRRRNWPRLWWLNLLLFLLTFLTTTVFGFALSRSFAVNQPLNLDWLFDGYVRLAHFDPAVWAGLSFSVPLLVILLAHEFGHYLACRRWEVDASLPYFLPSPLLLGTFGAFIRIRSPIYTRKILFDIGASGPYAGFALLVPIMFAGVWMSRLTHGAAFGQSFSFGTPLAMRLVEWLRFGSTSVVDIRLHPMAMAAWAGLLATAMNLLPLGQLDGGHILYAAMGERWHRTVATWVVAALVLLGFVYRAWWVWAIVMFLFGRRHPLVYDQTPLTGWRIYLSLAAIILLTLSLAVVPVSTK